MAAHESLEGLVASAIGPLLEKQKFRGHFHEALDVVVREHGRHTAQAIAATGMRWSVTPRTPGTFSAAMRAAWLSSGEPTMP